MSGLFIVRCRFVRAVYSRYTFVSRFVSGKGFKLDTYLSRFTYRQNISIVQEFSSVYVPAVVRTTSPSSWFVDFDCPSSALFCSRPVTSSFHQIGNWLVVVAHHLTTKCVLSFFLVVIIIAISWYCPYRNRITCYIAI